MSTTQLNLRFTDDFLLKARDYAQLNGYLNVQEFIRETVREKLYETPDINPEYLLRLRSKDAQTYISDNEADAFDKDLEKRANM